ncbi:MAG: hypothetical protein PHV30_05900 [Candidatus Margulisbacteria bacterium]|nr:hypothetical protein [Candidatus Margulisiibacteriota bacterium]
MTTVSKEGIVSNLDYSQILAGTEFEGRDWCQLSKDQQAEALKAYLGISADSSATITITNSYTNYSGTCDAVEFTISNCSSSEAVDHLNNKMVHFNDGADGTSDTEYLAILKVVGSKDHIPLIDAAFDASGIEGAFKMAVELNRPKDMDKSGTVHGTISNLGRTIDGLYNSMLDLANYLSSNSEAFEDPGQLFMMQTYLSMMKETIASLTAIGTGSVSKTLETSLQNFASAVKQ